MLVLGVDPGLTRCGLGAVRCGRGRSVELVAVDVVRTPADAPMPERLLALAEAIEGWIEQLRPDVVAVERVFSQHNVRTVMGTAQAAGVAILAGARAGIPVAVHTPSEVKAAVTGSGTAGKAQVTAMVTRLLRLPAAPRPADAADALALAICHAWRGSAAVEQVGAGTQTAAQRRWVEAAAATRRRPAVGRPAVGRPAGARPGVPGAGSSRTALP